MMTPGPWRLDHSTVMGDDGDPVVIIADPGGPANGERIDWPWVYTVTPPPAGYATAEDNARAIAALPDIIKAAQALWRVLDAQGAPVWAWDEVEALGAVLSDALGEPQ